MSGKTREELIHALYDDIVVGAKEEKKPEPSRFDQGSRSLMAPGSAIAVKNLTSGRSEIKRFEVILDKNEYSDILRGYRKFLIMTEDVRVNDTLIMREASNLALTGNSMLKTVIFVEDAHEGIKDGYRVICWK